MNHQVAIRGGRLIDGTGRDPVEKAGLVIEHGRIVRAGPIPLESSSAPGRWG